MDKRNTTFRFACMNEPSVFQQSPLPPAPVQRTSNRKRSIIIFLIILILLIAGLVALYLIGGTTKKAAPVTTVPTLAPQPTVAATPAASASASPTASPSASPLDRTKIRVSVQNGSGTPGAAQKYATALQSAGYTKVTSGNAESFDHNGVTIIVTKKFSNYLPLLQKDLAQTAGSAKILTSVDDTISTDAQVIIGK